VRPGTVAWAALAVGQGREQHGRRPVVAISSAGHLDVVDSLLVILPCTKTDRGWENHVRLDAPGLQVPTFAMTEQPQTISRARIRSEIGTVSPQCLDEILSWMSRWLAFDANPTTPPTPPGPERS